MKLVSKMSGKLFKLARGFKLGQLIGDDEQIICLTLNKFCQIFQNYGPLQIWPFQICQRDFSKSIRARGLKHSQLIEDDE